MDLGWLPDAYLAKVNALQSSTWDMIRTVTGRGNGKNPDWTLPKTEILAGNLFCDLLKGQWVEFHRVCILSTFVSVVIMSLRFCCRSIFVDVTKSVKSV